MQKYDDGGMQKGGSGSGNFGHAGRPGHVGGSAPAGADSGEGKDGEEGENVELKRDKEGYLKVKQDAFLNDGTKVRIESKRKVYGRFGQEAEYLVRDSSGRSHTVSEDEIKSGSTITSRTRN